MYFLNSIEINKIVFYCVTQKDKFGSKIVEMDRISRDLYSSKINNLQNKYKDLVKEVGYGKK